ncbi:hypothetical protein HRI_002407800 [Hibiscus trionum]|uniref:Ribosomal protein L34Ae n=1 Tax=Hibiscus trionum TaxID=183268 RepID=A0A9W7I4H0_HIBTR|nr:hypothetical protein HRI_002407800 [Hibiscus trionum]
MRRLIESMGAKRFTHFDFVFGFRVLNSFRVFLFKFIGSFFRLPMNGYQEDLGSNFYEFNERHSNDQGNRGGESSAMAASTSKYEFLYRKSISGFIEEPTTKSFTLHELHMGSIDSSNCNGGILDSSDSVGADFGKVEVEVGRTEETNAVYEDKTEECALRFSFQKSFDFEKHIKAIKEEDPIENYVGNPLVERTIEQPEQDVKDAREKTEQSVESFIAEIETEDIFEEEAEDSAESCVTEKILETEKTGDFFESTVIDKYLEKWHQENVEHGNHERNTCVSCEKAAIFEGPINLGQTQSEEDDKETESMVLSEKTIGQNMKDDEDDDDDLIERLKMEVKIARTGGLPTILEDFESPKMVVEPLQIDEKYDHKDHIAEIQKVYKSYSDKMRKLDILNSQTMHAISLLPLKDVPIQPSIPAKSSAPAIKSFHKALSFRQRKAGADPTMKLIRDLRKDFETVYVGQICLSWAILHWQFGQVKKLLECNTLSVHQYNQVAGEFQHFQVLLQRFLEDEPFRTRSRVENYINYRCSVRSLLQVPVIKDDCSKYKEEDAVSSEMLKDIIEESMHVFWEFLRADKDEPNSTSKPPFHSQVAPHDPIDFNLLMDVRTNLQKKEKRLKEIHRGTNCIIKKFQRQQHGGNLLDHALFIAHVELKLVSRVINMSKINTDQLVWCHEKLQRINFSGRKIEIEPSFTLFPC